MPQMVTLNPFKFLLKHEHTLAVNIIALFLDRARKKMTWVATVSDFIVSSKFVFFTMFSGMGH